MRLIGMYDSPYVRRTALSLHALNVPFEHHSISVFRGFEEFGRINPAVKAPTLVCDDGTVLMESTLIIEHAERMAGRSLMPAALDAHRQATRVVGLALIACEKAVQIVYEHNLRTPEKVHEPWLVRVRGQLVAALAALETEIAHVPLSGADHDIDQPGISAAVAWRFAREMTPDIAIVADHPLLAKHSSVAEQLPLFEAVPFDKS